MDDQYPFISVITVNYNGKAFLQDFFRSLHAADYPRERVELIMVDNGSTDGSLEYVGEAFPAVRVLQNDVNNYCRANNLGVRVSKGTYVAILNNDVKVDRGWLKHLVSAVQSDPGIGAAGSRILLMDGTPESMGHEELPDFYWVDQNVSGGDTPDAVRQVRSLSGCSVLYRKSALEGVGGFDEDFNLYMEDVDISLRMHAGQWKLFCVPQSVVYHVHHGTAGDELSRYYTERNRLMLIAKHCPERLCEALQGKGYFTAQRGLAAQGSVYSILPDLIVKLTKHHNADIVRAVLERLFVEVKKIESLENNILTEKIKESLKAVEARNRDITTLKNEIAGRDEALGKKDEHIRSLDGGIVKRDAAIGEKDAYIRDLKDGIAKRDEALGKKDEHIRSLNGEIVKRDAALNEKDAYLDNLINAHSEQLSLLNADLAVKTREIDDVYGSTVFRFMVRPLWTVLWRIKHVLGIVAGPASQTFASAPVQPNPQTQSTSGSITICTIISKNYLSYARVLAASFLAHNKGRVFVLLTDRVDGYFDPSKEKFTLIELDAIKPRIPEFDRFCFQYNPTELNTAVKPFFLEFLFETYHLRDIIFLDPDILIAGELGGLAHLLSRHSIILIPHITRPYTDMRKPSEIDILKSGVYNLGFIALADGETTRTLLGWWKDRLRRYCVSDVEKGLFVDQKWIDLVPGFFQDVCILRDEAYNIAYWNFHSRPISMINGVPYVGDIRARFIHFSGCSPDEPAVVSRHQDRFRWPDLGHMAPLYREYCALLKASGYDTSRKWPCVYDYFDNGARIPDLVRKMYWDMAEDARRFGDPAKARGKSFFNWLHEPLDRREPVITRLMREIYNKRADLQKAYPDIFGADRKDFSAWFWLSASHEYKLDAMFLDRVRSSSGSRTFRNPLGARIVFFHKCRALVKRILKAVYKNDLGMIHRLRNIELGLYRKIRVAHRVPSDSGRRRAPAVPGPCGVNIFGYLTAESGVGQGARASTRCLEAAGAKISLINIEDHISRKDDLSLASRFSRGTPYAVNLIHVNADMFGKFVVEQGNGHFAGKYNIGRWTWELSEFPDHWRGSFAYCDEIWVPSAFVCKAVSAKSPVPVKVMPHAVEVAAVKQVGRDRFALGIEDYVFLFMFDFLSYFDRKNPLAVIRAFKRAFSASDRARLVIKCINSSFDPGSFAKIKQEAAGSKVDILDRYHDRDEVDALLSNCDAYISLHRSEGFGLTMAEAMYLGKPVIATNYSGNLDFMNSRNSYPVDFRITEISSPAGPYARGNVWAEPDVKHAARLMRHVYEHRDEAREIGRIAAADIRANLGYHKIGCDMKERVDQITAQCAC